MKYSSITLGPRIKVSAIPEDIDGDGPYDWRFGSIKMIRFCGRPVWTSLEQKIVRSEASWKRWIEEERSRGYDWNTLAGSAGNPIVVTLDARGQLTLWDGFHRVAMAVFSRAKVIRAKIGVPEGVEIPTVPPEE